MQRTNILRDLLLLGCTVPVVARHDSSTARARDGGAHRVVRSIDELPILAVLAARARGTTVVRDAEELRVKESDRIATTCAMLRGFGIQCEVHPDGFTVEGQPIDKRPPQWPRRPRWKCWRQ